MNRHDFPFGIDDLVKEIGVTNPRIGEVQSFHQDMVYVIWDGDVHGEYVLNADLTLVRKHGEDTNPQ